MIRTLFFVFIVTTGRSQTQRIAPKDSLAFFSSFENKYSESTPHVTSFTRAGAILDLTKPRNPLAGQRLTSPDSKFYHKPKPPKQKYQITSFSAGAWVPLGRNQILGSHPSFGCVLGQWTGQWLWELQGEFRFGNAANNYKLIFQDTVRTSNQYFGGYIGLHVGYGFINTKYSSIYVLGGVGYDGFDAWDSYDADGNDNGLSIGSLNLNGGLGIQHFGRVRGYWSLEFLYNAIWYKNRGGTPLDGNALTIRLAIGGIRGL